MTGVLLVDDEPLVLIGMQGMLNWAALGYEVVGTARNGAEALRAVQEKQPDIVVSDIRMPVMDGFALAEACHKDGSALPAFIMLTSYEEFDYVKRSMRLGVVDYLVKIDLTADSLTAALEHARATAEKEKKLRMPSPAPVSLDTFRDRLFLQLYGGLFTDRAVFDRQCAELGVTFKAPRHIVAVGSLQTPDLPTSQLVTLSTQVPPLPRDRHGSAAFLGAAAAGSGRGPRGCTGSDPENRRADFVQLFQHCHLLGGGPPGERHFKDQREPARRLCRAAAAA